METKTKITRKGYPREENLMGIIIAAIPAMALLPPSVIKGEKKGGKTKWSSRINLPA